MQWSEVLNDPSLKNLPYKIELNEYGQIVMSPASNKHGLLQAEIAFFLRNNRQGKVLTECSIETSKSVKVADVAWGSIDFFQRNGIDTPYHRHSAPHHVNNILNCVHQLRTLEIGIERGLFLQ